MARLPLKKSVSLSKPHKLIIYFNISKIQVDFYYDCNFILISIYSREEVFVAG